MHSGLHRSSSWILLIFLLVLAGSTVRAQPPCIDYSDYLRYVDGVPLEYITYDFMGYSALTIKGRKAYAYQYGRGLRVIDIIDPADLVHRGMLLSGYQVSCSGLSSVDHYVLMACDDLRVVDVDNHDNPVLVGTHDTPGSAHGVAVAQRIAYVADEASGISVYDFDNSLAPVHLTTIPTTGPAWSVRVHGDLLLVGCQNWLDIFSLDIPTLPVFLGTADIAGNVEQIAASGDLALVTAGYDAMIVDISDPTAPTVQSTFGDHIVRSVTMLGNVAYLGGDITPWRGGSVDRFDVTDPTNPTRIGRDIMNGWPGAMALAIGYLFCANQGDWMDGAESEGFHAFDVTYPESAPRLGYLDLASYNYNWGTSDFEGDFLYVAGETRLGIVDVSDPTNPNLRGSYYWSNDFSREAHLVNGFLVVLHKSGYPNDYFLHTYDVSNPVLPQQVGYWDIPGSGTVGVRDNLIYLSTPSMVYVIEVEDSGAMTVVGTFWQDYPVGRFIFDGDRAITTFNGTMLVVDFPGIDTPEILGELPPAPSRNRWPWRLHGDLVFTRHSLTWENWPFNDTWEIIDLSDPAHPMVLSEVPLPFEDYFGDLVFDGDETVYVSSSTSDWVFNITDPENPVFWGQAPHPTANDCMLHLGEGILVSHSLPGALISVYPQQCAGPTDVTMGEVVPATSEVRISAAPNPFNPRTEISFYLDLPQQVTVAVFDLAGRRLSILSEGKYAAGRHTVLWTGQDPRGRQLPSGAYVVRLITENTVMTEKITLVR